MNDSVIPFALLCFTSFFTLINPLGTMPVFLSMTTGMSESERRRIIMKSTFVAFLIMISFTIFGQVIFQVFGLSTNGFRIAGGIVIMKIGYDMLQAHYTHIKLNEDEKIISPMIFQSPLWLFRCCAAPEPLPTALC